MNLFKTILCDSRLTSTEKCLILLILEDGNFEYYDYYCQFLDISLRSLYNCLHHLFECGYLLKGKRYIINASYISSLTKRG